MRLRLRAPLRTEPGPKRRLPLNGGGGKRRRGGAQRMPRDPSPRLIGTSQALLGRRTAPDPLPPPRKVPPAGAQGEGASSGGLPLPFSPLQKEPDGAKDAGVVACYWVWKTGLSRGDGDEAGAPLGWQWPEGARQIGGPFLASPFWAAASGLWADAVFAPDFWGGQ